MKLFAALERALLARWKKVKYALKVERWPLLNIKEQRLQLKKQYLESLFKKKWQKFERSIYVVHKGGLPHCGSQYNTALSLSENRESHESNCNKDALDAVD